MTRDDVLTKVPEVTLVFWIIKIAATTLGETGGDTVTMTLDWGYLIGTAIFLARWSCWSSRRSSRRNFIRSCTGRRSSPPPPSARPWPISPTARSASATPAARRSCLLCLHGRARRCGTGRKARFRSRPSSRRRSRHSTGRRSRFRRRSAPRSATGSPTPAASATKAARWCSAPALALLAAAYYWTSVSRVMLFWAAFILTRPLGATVGDFLDKPVSQGGLH